MVDFNEIMDLDADEKQALLIESIKATIANDSQEAERSFAQACNAETNLLEALAKALRNSSYGDEVAELIEQLEMTADFNPLSETAEDLKVEAMEWL